MFSIVERIALLALRVTSPDWPCLALYVDPNGLLLDVPTSRTPAQWGTIYIGDSQIIPRTVYQVTAENRAYGSLPAAATTWQYGDANHSGVVNLDDILCVLSGFGGVFADCLLYGVDSIGTFFNPDHTVSLDDILAVLAAFGGTGYTASTPCG